MFEVVGFGVIFMAELLIFRGLSLAEEVILLTGIKRKQVEMQMTFFFVILILEIKFYTAH